MSRQEPEIAEHVRAAGDGVLELSTAHSAAKESYGRFYRAFGWGRLWVPSC